MRRFASLGFILMLAGCGGSGGSHGPTILDVTQPPAHTSPATITFVMPRKSSTSRRSPAYITAALRSVLLQVTAVRQHGSNVDITSTFPPVVTAPQIVDIADTTGNPNLPGQCGTDPANAQNVKCTATFALPVGDDSVAIAAFDAAHGGGNRISQQRTVFAVPEGASVFSVVLDANAQTIAITPISTALVGNGTGSFAVYTGSAVTAGVVVSDAHGTPVDPATPGAPVVTASSSDPGVLTATVSGSTLTIHPVSTSGRASVTITANPATAGDGLTAVAVTVVVTLAVPTGSLFVANADGVNVYPAAASGNAVPQRKITGLSFSTSGANGGGGQGYASRTVSAIAAGATHGAVAVLFSHVAHAQSPGFFINEFGPAADGAQAVNDPYEFNGSGRAIAAVPGGAGYDAVSSVGTVVTTSPPTLFRTVAYTNGSPVYGIAVDAGGNVYVSTQYPNGVDVYAPGATGNAIPFKTIRTASFPERIAIGPDGTLYVIERTGSSGLTTGYSIEEFAPGATSPARLLGPFAPDVPVSAIAVDAQNELYVAQTQVANGSLTGNASITVFAPGASGAATPIRTLPNPIRDIVDIAAGP